MTDNSQNRTGWRGWHVAVLVVVVAFLGLIGVNLQRTQQGQVAVGERAPNFTLTGFANTPFAGQTFDLNAARGQVVVVNFWASWCLPCRDEAADLEDLWQTYRDRGVQVVGIAWTDTERESLSFIREYNQTYFNGPDLGTRAAQAYRIRGVPETYIVDQNGVLTWVKIGPITRAEVAAVLESLLP